MYGKLFASLYQGTLRGRSNEILVFTNLLAHADALGIVDKHWRAIAEETGLSKQEVEEAIANLEAPDPESRSPEADGCRIVKLDEHRAWGWRIVNYMKYRAIRNEEDRREQNRLAQERWRNAHSNKNKPRSAKVSRDKPQSAQGEVEEEEEEEEEERTPTPIPPPGKINGKKPQVTFKTFLENCKASGEKPISSYKPVFDYAAKIGLPPEFVALCWNEFRRRYGPGGTSSSKRYADWRRAFQKCVEGNWFRLWYMDGDKYLLTTQGMTAEKANRGDAQ